MQIILANKCPVDIKYRYITGSPTRRYKTVKSLDKELTAQSVPQPVKKRGNRNKISIRSADKVFLTSRGRKMVITQLPHADGVHFKWAVYLIRR